MKLLEGPKYSILTLAPHLISLCGRNPSFSANQDLLCWMATRHINEIIYCIGTSTFCEHPSHLGNPLRKTRLDLAERVLTVLNRWQHILMRNQLSHLYASSLKISFISCPNDTQIFFWVGSGTNTNFHFRFNEHFPRLQMPSVQRPCVP